ncbi:YveK family protein [Paenibacillus whitsoniae]|uniref:Polysaccharide chain length determinant N-terminal domain-containing protein n=1 Tax=Paenibacillus whitsoniae TaxID=2496558 RepID=A0A430JAR8_9BACL|nr:Wzz/FepE/Etk N-terminal domain-containing protein [Paenibacillus whitsoniae]RTE08110.1 hypothetical protein EJQ19_18620 [Paenibacillus whitsoniae]
MELELREYVQLILRRWWIIATVVALVTLSTGIVSYVFLKPVYAANAKIIVNKLNDNSGVQIIDSSTINASILLVNTYKEIVKTPAILEKVLARFPESKLTIEELAKKISVNSTNDTQVITLAASDESFAEAQRLVNAVVDVFKQEIPTIMNVDNVNILYKAMEQSNPRPVKNIPEFNIAISFLVSLIIAIGLVILWEYLNETIRTEKDVELFLEVPMLAAVSKIRSKDLKVNRRQMSQISLGEAVNVNVAQTEARSR